MEAYKAKLKLELEKEITLNAKLKVKLQEELQGITTSLSTTSTEQLEGRKAQALKLKNRTIVNSMRNHVNDLAMEIIKIEKRSGSQIEVKPEFLTENLGELFKKNAEAWKQDSISSPLVVSEKEYLQAQLAAVLDSIKHLDLRVQAQKNAELDNLNEILKAKTENFKKISDNNDNFIEMLKHYKGKLEQDIQKLVEETADVPMDEAISE